MIRQIASLAALAAMAACGDGQPIIPPSQAQLDAAADQELDLPPGTDDAGASDGIFRFEERDEQGGGLVTDVSYNARRDTFTVDNLGFDGPNVYKRKRGDLRTLGTARVFQARDTTPDFLTGKPVGQIVPYVALYGVSRARVDGEPRTSYAIVRTGGYAGFGFGGYVYERNGDVVLPEGGQATFSGDYAGLRVFGPGKGGLEYVTGDMSIDIDFEDFNANDAVKGTIGNRRFFDSNGRRLATSPEEGFLKDPNVNFVVREGVPSINDAGEIEAELRNFIVNPDGEREIYEEGTFTGIIAGDTTRGRGGEIVGVVKLTAEDPREEGTFMQETGGAILKR